MPTATAHESCAADTFEQYVSARYAYLLRCAHCLTGNPLDAEDLLQSALAKAYVAWDRIRDKRAADAYVRRTLVNTQRSWWRRHRVTEISTDELPEAQAGGDPTAAVEIRDIVADALALLPKRQRAMIVLRYCADYSEAETARALGVAVGTVKSSVSRGLTRLRGELGGQHGMLAALGMDMASIGRPQAADASPRTVTAAAALGDRPSAGGTRDRLRCGADPAAEPPAGGGDTPLALLAVSA